MSHDPERSAAWYLGGQFSRRKRREFELHMLECEDCWREVESGRSGRAVAESARELAPQALRERVRSTIAAMDAPARRWGLRRREASIVALAVTVVASVAAVTVLTAGPSQPQEIELAVANFADAGHIGPEVAGDLPREVDGFDLVQAEAGLVGDLEVTAHTYESTEGEVVVVYRADDPFPLADNATHDPGSLTWSARHDGALLFCSDRPVPTLVVGNAEDDVLGLAEALDLR